MAEGWEGVSDHTGKLPVDHGRQTADLRNPPWPWRVVMAETAALVALSQHGIPSEAQELLLQGDGLGKVAPGALRKALLAAAEWVEREDG